MTRMCPICKDEELVGYRPVILGEPPQSPPDLHNISSTVYKKWKARLVYWCPKCGERWQEKEGILTYA